MRTILNFRNCLIVFLVILNVVVLGFVFFFFRETNSYSETEIRQTVLQEVNLTSQANNTTNNENNLSDEIVVTATNNNDVVVVPILTFDQGANLSETPTAEMPTADTITVHGDCTLVDAIVAANTDAASGGCPAGQGDDVIVLTESIVLRRVYDGLNGLPEISSGITIEGNGFTISRDRNSPLFRLFYIGRTGDLTLHGITINQGNAANGGCIANNGRLAASDLSLSDCHTDEMGGAIYNSDVAFATIEGCHITSSYAEGGHIALAVVAGGGAIFNGGILNLSDCELEYNSTGEDGGAIYNDGHMTTNTIFIQYNDASSYGHGAGIFNREEFIIQNSIIMNNFPNDIYNEYGSISVVSSSFDDCYNYFGQVNGRRGSDCSEFAVPIPTPTPQFSPTPTFIPSPIPTTSLLELAEKGIEHNLDWTPFVQEFDGVEMVLVPAGCFMMGSNDGNDDEQPVHEICFDEPFWIDRYEVTNSQFTAFGGQAGRASNWTDGNLPRDQITWVEAFDFCKLRGGRLPTEAEWEYAARGPDAWVYPWGNDFDEDNVVYSGNSERHTWAVGSKPDGVSWVGVLDMSGNVSEWTSSLYKDYPYNREFERGYLDANSSRVRRGGWFLDAGIEVRATNRDDSSASVRGNDVGWRCARSR